MKVDRYGQARVLNSAELRVLFTEGLRTPRDRALFGVCLYTACRISEALALRTEDVAGGVVTFRRATTKGKLRTRAVAVHPELENLLAACDRVPGYLFPGRHRWAPLTRVRADRILAAACEQVGLVGVSTHSFRRTALTQMSSAGVPLRVIQEVSGHQDLGTLQRYLEVSAEQKRMAIEVVGW